MTENEKILHDFVLSLSMPNMDDDLLNACIDRYNDYSADEAILVLQENAFSAAKFEMAAKARTILNKLKGV